MRAKTVSAVEHLRRLNEFALGPEPDFKNMPKEDVDLHLRKRGLDARVVYRKAMAELLDRKE